ncbi:hypothetical protein VTL71DRAFT_2390 [Oculimacula yallundae]|uniref:Transmembrane protein n=1 Tax=Oculimacula yallundae TaxID=86028 RepID=A0ABR4CAR1_9HELO
MRQSSGMFSLQHRTCILLAIAALLGPSACESGRQYVMSSDGIGIHKKPSSPSIEVVTASPGPGSVQRYTEPGSCSSLVPIATNSITYAPDECQNLNPHEIAQIQILSPAICPNGTRAVFTVFGSSNCWGSVSQTTQVSDEVVGRCIDASQVWSCAFVCEGLPDGAPVGKILAAVAVVGGLAVVGLGLLTGLFFCGGGLMVVALVGLCLWGFWILVHMIMKAFRSSPRPAEAGQKDEITDQGTEETKKRN